MLKLYVTEIDLRIKAKGVMFSLLLSFANQICLHIHTIWNSLFAKQVGYGKHQSVVRQLKFSIIHSRCIG